MSIFSHVPRLLPTLILGASLLTACGGEDSATLVPEARAMLAAGNYKAAMIQLNNAVAADEKNPEARYELGKRYLDQNDLVSAEKEFLARARQELNIRLDRRVSFVAEAETRSLYEQLTTTP